MSSLRFPFKLLNGKFLPLDLFATLGVLQGWKEREITSEFSASNPEWCTEVRGQAESHPVPGSPSYFHWALLFWLQFSPHAGVTTVPGETKMQDSAGWSHCPLVTKKVGLWLGLCFCSDTWTIHTLLDTYEGRKLDFLRLQMYQQGCTAEN